MLEQDGELFAEACEEHKDEAYFQECTNILKKWGSIVKEGEDMARSSWVSLYGIVLLLTEEYLATKLDNGLPAVEVSVCSGNGEAANLELIITPRSASEGDLNGASMSALESLRDSSDFIVFDDLENSFYKFLRDNFPFRGDQDGFKEFFMNIYDEDVCTDGNLDWLYGKIFNGSALGAELRLSKIEVGAMRGDILGAYRNGDEGREIYISQRLVLDSLRSPESSFILLITLLHEYGHFLDDVLHDRARRSGGDSEGDEGLFFASRFMDCAAGNLYTANFKFAELSATDYKGRMQKFPLEIPDVSELSYESRKSIAAILELGRNFENDGFWEGTLELPKENRVIGGMEFYEPFGLFTYIGNIRNGSHEKLTEDAITRMQRNPPAELRGLESEIKCTEELKKGSSWPDFPSDDELVTGMPSSIAVIILPKSINLGIASVDIKCVININDMAYASHFGVRQYWHSMYPQLTEVQEPQKIDELVDSIDLIITEDPQKIRDLKRYIKFNNGKLTNESVSAVILEQCKLWYKQAMKYKRGGEDMESFFTLGKLCHMVQDSYVLAHSWRRYIGDERYDITGLNRINAGDNGKIWTFQDYTIQDSSLHCIADSLEQKTEPQANGDRKVATIGYKSAVEATREIMTRYFLDLGWTDSANNISSLEAYLEGVYQICSSEKTESSGKSHPWFSKAGARIFYFIRELYNRHKIKKKVSKISSDYAYEIVGRI